MNKHTYIIALLTGVFAFSSCQNKDWDVPEGIPYGNNSLEAGTTVTIAELQTRYANTISSDNYKQITEDLWLRCVVNGNDYGDNLYKQLSVQDETGGIIIGINGSDQGAYMPVGQKLLISLKDLYIGGYGRMAQIGTPYNNNGRMQIGRMAQYVWANHFKVVNPKAELITPQPVDFNTVKGSIDANAGKLVVLKGVTFANANGKKRLVDGVQAGGNYYNQSISGMSNVVVRTSSYADFAAMVMPYDTINKKPIPCDIVGIAGRFNNDWQILIRKTSDISLTK